MNNINPGYSESSLKHLVNVNGALFFNAPDGDSGIELWIAKIPADDIVPLPSLYTPVMLAVAAVLVELMSISWRRERGTRD